MSADLLYHDTYFIVVVWNPTQNILRCAYTDHGTHHNCAPHQLCGLASQLTSQCSGHQVLILHLKPPVNLPIVVPDSY